MHESGHERKEKLCQLDHLAQPRPPAAAEQVWANYRSAKEQHFNRRLLKIPHCIDPRLQHGPMGIHHGSMAQQRVLGVQQKHLGTTIAQEQVFMSCRAFQR